MQLTINNHPFTFDLPKENPYLLAKLHAHCKTYGRLITAAKIEAEIAKRSFQEQVLISRLGYVAVEGKLFS